MTTDIDILPKCQCQDCHQTFELDTQEGEPCPSRCPACQAKFRVEDIKTRRAWERYLQKLRSQDVGYQQTGYSLLKDVA